MTISRIIFRCKFVKDKTHLVAKNLASIYGIVSYGAKSFPVLAAARQPEALQKALHPHQGLQQGQRLLRQRVLQADVLPQIRICRNDRRLAGPALKLSTGITIIWVSTVKR